MNIVACKVLVNLNLKHRVGTVYGRWCNIQPAAWYTRHLTQVQHCVANLKHRRGTVYSHRCNIQPAAWYTGLLVYWHPVAWHWLNIVACKVLLNLKHRRGQSMSIGVTSSRLHGIMAPVTWHGLNIVAYIFSLSSWHISIYLYKNRGTVNFKTSRQ